MHAPPLWLLILWSAFVLQAWLSVLIVWKFHRLFSPKRYHKMVSPRLATVIVPFRGIDDDLPRVVRNLCEQDYPDYQLFLVVESRDDPAYGVLCRELERYPKQRAEILIAGPAGKHEGQKVHNQLFALSRVYDVSDALDAWVFADSDAAADRDWLTRLIGSLEWGEKTGVASGYRWLMPEAGAGFWSHIASVINSSVACLAGRDKWNQAWGGTMAIRAFVAREGDLRGKLDGALCDDYQFTRLCREMGKRVYFVPRCLVATRVRFTFSSFMNFAHRQYLLTRVYSPPVFLAAFAVTTLYVAGFFSALAVLMLELVRGPVGRAWLWPAGALIVAFVADQLRSTLRRRVIHRAFGEEGPKNLRATLLFDRFATPLWMTIHWLIVVRSCFGRRMRWRGILYRLDGPQKCERLD